MKYYFSFFVILGYEEGVQTSSSSYDHSSYIYMYLSVPSLHFPYLMSRRVYKYNYVQYIHAEKAGEGEGGGPLGGGRNSRFGKWRDIMI